MSDVWQTARHPLVLLRLACDRVGPGKLKLLVAAFSECLASDPELEQVCERLRGSAALLDLSPATARSDILRELEGAFALPRSNRPDTLFDRLTELIREIVPPTPASRLPAGWIRWGRGQLLRMARQIQQEQRFEELPVIADALQDAGIDDPRILAHCRAPRRHHPGCWVLELLLAGPAPKKA